MGGSLELRDGVGTKLAQLKSAGFPGAGERRLDIFVPHDALFLDMVVLSSLAAKKSMKNEGEAASELISGILGA